MIRVHKAPAGYIAQGFSNKYLDPEEQYGIKQKNIDSFFYLDVSGKWCESEEDAIKSFFLALKKKQDNTRRKIEKLQEKLAELEQDHTHIERDY